MNLTFCCTPDNDLYTVLTRSGARFPRVDDAIHACDQAKPGTAVLLLADGYPVRRTLVPDAVLRMAEAKHLRLFVEYPESLPGVALGAARHVTWERAVIASDAFGADLPRLRILALPDCHFLPAAAPKPLLVAARVAGFDTAVYGLPTESHPLLFELPERHLLIATTRLSGFLRGRYAPTAAWQTIWRYLLERLDAGKPAPALTWTPSVRPAYGKDQPLPANVEQTAIRNGARWVHRSRLLLSPKRAAEVHILLRDGKEIAPMPPAKEPNGDGACGILEGYTAAVQSDGSQDQRLPLRADCHAETAMTLALNGALHRDAHSARVARNLLDYVYFTSGMQGGVRGNPAHPAYGLIAWGIIAPLWEIGNYGDDNARTLLATMAAAAFSGADTWDAPLLTALLANLRTTGTLGFRGDRVDIPDLERRGWKAYYDAPTVSLSPHFESYLWACYLWAYRHTGYSPFLERTRTAIRRTMEGYPNGWRWRDTLERARMLLCLAWLVRLEPTPEHHRWLDSVAGDLLAVQQPCGALQERSDQVGGHYGVPRSNEEYGTTETPLIQQNGDPASDQLYTSGFALFGLREAVAATGNPVWKEAEDRLARYLCRIQIRSERHPHLAGAWFRAFDYARWEYWASSADMGWGAWCVESGWGQAWTLAALGLRQKDTSLWEWTQSSRIAKHFDAVQERMRQNDGGPWKPEKA